MQMHKNLRQPRENKLKHKKEQIEYFQRQIYKIRNTKEYRKVQLAWLTVNEVSRKENTLRSKLKDSSQEE